MATTQYIGARYVPLIGRKGESSAIWDNSAPYEPLTVVTYQGDSYTSRQSVPAGIAITNTDYWVKTGDYNAQVASYSQQVTNLQSNVSAVEDALPVADFSGTNTVKAAIDGIADVLPLSEFDSVNTVKAAIDAASGGIVTDVDEIKDDIANIESVIPFAEFDSTNTVKAAIDAEAAARADAIDGLRTSLTNSINAEVNARTGADSSINSRINNIDSFLPQNYSQSDTMQDYIIETGRDNYWTYRKWASGIAECWGMFPTSVPLGSRVARYSTFPDGLFAAKPIINANCNMTGTTDAEVNYVEATSSNSWTTYVYGSGSGTADCNIFLTAHGVWK